MAPEKIKITAGFGVATEVGNGKGWRTFRPKGLQVEAWDAGNGYYNFQYNGVTWQIQHYKCKLGWSTH